jgi:FAD:protein FMN transferase
MLTLARHAMATRFELVLHGDQPGALRAAGEEALDEIERVENQFSLYRSHTEIAQLNARAADEWVRVSPPVFRLLEHARRLSEETGGAFDITAGTLVRCWGFQGGTGHKPSPEAITDARACVGMNLVEMNASASAVRFSRPGVLLDLGAIGKGYAIDRAVELLRAAGVTSALLHGGTSTTVAIGAPPDAAAWSVAVDLPSIDATSPSTRLAAISLRDESLSVSAVWGRSFQSGDERYGHVIDPRTGHPVRAALLAALVLPSATESDALSTALLLDGPEGFAGMMKARPSARALVVTGTEVAPQIHRHGLPAPATSSAS